METSSFYQEKDNHVLTVFAYYLQNFSLDLHKADVLDNVLLGDIASEV